ncbi:MAG: pyruvate formate-lyase-activating protein [Planctomycetota bacterium]
MIAIDEVALPILDPVDHGDVGDRVLRTAGEIGYVHSHENASAVDGPGLRYVVWLVGCLLRCKYCHNPDTWKGPPNGTRQSPEDVLADVERYAPFLRSAGGGFTLSSGEPLLQAPFAMRLFRGAKRLGLHTALDTNGFLGGFLTDDDLAEIDLVLLDLKAFDAEQHRRVTGAGNKPILAFARRLAELGRPTWVRFVLVPGLTDVPDDLHQLAEFVAGLSNVERLEVLPFHQMGEPKWKQLGVDYPLKGVSAATDEQAEVTRDLFRVAGCPVV